MNYMFVKLNHPRYHGIENTGESLFLLNQQMTLPLYTGKILASAVTLSDLTIYCAAIVKEDTIRYWYGDENFSSEEIKVDGGVIRGLKLLTDAQGVPHLFYLLYNHEFRRTGCTLIHRIFQPNRWSEPIRVTTNINSYVDNWQVCFDVGNYLHVIYLNQEKDILFYRNLDLQTRSWSGAIPLAQEECDNPQIYFDSTGLTIFWISIFGKSKSLKVIQKGTAWGKPYDLSPKSSEVYHPALSFDTDLLTIMWIQDGKLWASNYSKQQWSQPSVLPKDEYQLYYQAVMASKNKGCCTLHLYRSKNKKVSVVPDKENNQIHIKTPKVEQNPVLEVEQSIKEVEIERRIQERLELRLKQLIRESDLSRLDLRAEVTTQIEKIEAQLSRYRSFSSQIKNLELKIITLETAVKRNSDDISPKFREEELGKSIFQRILSRFQQ